MISQSNDFRLMIMIFIAGIFLGVVIVFAVVDTSQLRISKDAGNEICKNITGQESYASSSWGDDALKFICTIPVPIPHDTISNSSIIIRRGSQK